MIKMQHPEYELFTQNSTHYNAGVACADCHMPYTRDGAVKYLTHDVKSPLLNAEAACGQCHTDVGYVTTRVATIQKQVNDTLIATEDAIVAAITAIKAAAATPGVDETLLTEARTLHHEAQLRWDFIAAENSMGFHNPEEALRILAKATDQARQAVGNLVKGKFFNHTHHAAQIAAQIEHDGFAQLRILAHNIAHDLRVQHPNLAVFQSGDVDGIIPAVKYRHFC